MRDHSVAVIQLRKRSSFDGWSGAVGVEAAMIKHRLPLESPNGCR